MKHPNRNGRRKRRQQEAAERQAAYDALPHSAKIERAASRASQARLRIHGLIGGPVLADNLTRELRRLGA